MKRIAAYHGRGKFCVRGYNAAVAEANDRLPRPRAARRLGLSLEPCRI